MTLRNPPNGDLTVIGGILVGWDEGFIADVLLLELGDLGFEGFDGHGLPPFS
jgi:hypothetical protein